MSTEYPQVPPAGSYPTTPAENPGSATGYPMVTPGDPASPFGYPVASSIAPTPRGRANPVGIIALIIGVLPLLAYPLSARISMFAMMLFLTPSVPTFVLHLVLAVTATILGIVGLTLRGRSKTAAAVGLGFGAVSLYLGLFLAPVVQIEMWLDTIARSLV